MTNQIHDKIILDLDSLLDRERTAILSGALDSLAGIMSEKSSLIDSLALIAPSADELDRVRVKAHRNQDLIESAMDGIRAVTQRLATMRRLRASMDTYDSSGQRRKITGIRSGNVEKRA